MRKLIFMLVITFVILCGAVPTFAATGGNNGNEIKLLGHSTCQITTARGIKILVDPWVTGNPVCSTKKEDVKPDIILVTHDHIDHIGTDIPYFVQESGSMVIAHYDLVPKLIEAGVDAKHIITDGMGMNIGGQVEVKGVKVLMTEAAHSANSVGYIITLEDGTTIYHAGDTGLFGGMELLGKLYSIDLALIPIGNVFTMGPRQAAYSLTLLKPKQAIPIHYGSFKILEKDPAEFIKLSKEKAPYVKITVLNPGEGISI